MFVLTYVAIIAVPKYKPHATGITAAVCAIACCVGFYKFVYFLSIGYGFAVAAGGVTTLIMYLINPSATPWWIVVVQAALFVAYGGTYLVSAAHTGEVQASKIIMGFCLGMGFGRMISGFLSIKFRCKTMLMVYSVALLLPAVILLFNLPLFMLYVVFCLIGAMSGPVYPLLIYLAPELFGKERSHAVLGTQIAVAYSGFVVSQLLMSFIVSLLSINIFPILCLVFSAMLFVFVFMLRKSADKN